MRSLCFDIKGDQFDHTWGRWSCKKVNGLKGTWTHGGISQIKNTDFLDLCLFTNPIGKWLHG